MSEQREKEPQGERDSLRGQDGDAQKSPSPEEVKRRRRQRVYKALLEAKGQLIVVPDDVIH